MPITPTEAKRNKLRVIPPEVLEAFDELITKNLRGSTAKVIQKEVIDLIEQKLHINHEQFVFAWLDVEPLYKDAGWEVTYDKPGYNENYLASFNFTEKR